MFVCGYSGVRVAAFFEKLAHFLAFVVKVGIVTAEASRSEQLREWDGIFYVFTLRVSWLEHTGFRKITLP